MEQMFVEILSRLNQGENVVLCSIISSAGSTPRGAGAKMAVFADGTQLGTIGGGAVEFHGLQTALEVHGTGQSQEHGFVLKPNQVADIGMICGGDVRVYFQFFSSKNQEIKDLLGDILAVLPQKVNSWLVTSMGQNHVWDMGLYVEGQGLIGAGSLTHEDVFSHCLKKVILVGDLYVEPLTRSSTVYIFGGGHVSQALVPVIAQVDFRTVVYENRQEFAQKSLFPAAYDVVLGSFQGIDQDCHVAQGDYIIIMTRGHKDDYDVLRQALNTRADYIGVIGSRRKVATTFAKLLEDGFPQTDLDRIYTPIGLEIGAETPAEIAISVAAQLIAHRAKAKEVR